MSVCDLAILSSLVSCCLVLGEISSRFPVGLWRVGAVGFLIEALDSVRQSLEEHEYVAVVKRDAPFYTPPEQRAELSGEACWRRRARQRLQWELRGVCWARLELADSSRKDLLKFSLKSTRQDKRKQRQNEPPRPRPKPLARLKTAGAT